MEKYSSYLADYIRPVIDKKYRTRSDAADDLGIDQAVLSRICSGKRFGISEHLVENICLRLGLDTAEGLLRLFLSKNPKIKQHFLGITKRIAIEIVHPDKHKPAGNSNKLISDCFVPVPLAKTNSLTDIKSNAKTKKIEYTLMPKDFLPKKGSFIAFKIKDEFMAPTLPEGSIVTVNLDNTQESHNSLYLFKCKNEAKIGRLLLQENFIQLSPDNPNKSKYQSYIFDIEKSRKDNVVLGKVVWTFKKF